MKYYLVFFMQITAIVAHSLTHTHMSVLTKRTLDLKVVSLVSFHKVSVTRAIDTYR